MEKTGGGLVEGHFPRSGLDMFQTGWTGDEQTDRMTGVVVLFGVWLFEHACMCIFVLFAFMTLHAKLLPFRQEPVHFCMPPSHCGKHHPLCICVCMGRLVTEDGSSSI